MIKILQPYRGPGEYACYLAGVTAAAEALGYCVDSESWGGGIPSDLTLYEPTAVEAAPDVFEREAENAAIPDAEPEENSQGAETDGEPLASA